MSKSGENLGQLFSKLPEFFDLLRSNGVAKGKTGRLKCSRIYQECRAPTSVRINANLHSRGLPQLFRLKSTRRYASRSHGRLRPALRRSGFAGPQFAANQVSDRVTLEADDSGGDFGIGGGGEAQFGG